MANWHAGIHTARKIERRNNANKPPPPPKAPPKSTYPLLEHRDTDTFEPPATLGYLERTRVLDLALAGGTTQDVATLRHRGVIPNMGLLRLKLDRKEDFAPWSQDWALGLGTVVMFPAPPYEAPPPPPPDAVIIPVHPESTMWKRPAATPINPADIIAYPWTPFCLERAVYNLPVTPGELCTRSRLEWFWQRDARDLKAEIDADEFEWRASSKPGEVVVVFSPTSNTTTSAPGAAAYAAAAATDADADPAAKPEKDPDALKMGLFSANHSLGYFICRVWRPIGPIEAGGMAANITIVGADTLPAASLGLLASAEGQSHAERVAVLTRLLMRRARNWHDRFNDAELEERIKGLFVSHDEYKERVGVQAYNDQTTLFGQRIATV